VQDTRFDSDQFAARCHRATVAAFRTHSHELFTAGHGSRASLTTAARTCAAPRSRSEDDRLQWSLLPRASPEAHAALVGRIDTVGSTEFTRETLAELERNNLELLLMMHNFAEEQTDLCKRDAGFAQLYANLFFSEAQGAVFTRS
jgi:hypothetical protein